MTVKKKITSLDQFLQENSEPFISTFKPQIRFLFADDNFVVNGIFIFIFLYLLALPDERQRIIAHSEDGFTGEELATPTVFYIYTAERTFLRGNVIRLIGDQ